MTGSLKVLVNVQTRLPDMFHSAFERLVTYSRPDVKVSLVQPEANPVCEV